jgi:hypothetical protein
MLDKDLEEMGYGKLVVYLDSMVEDYGFFEDYDDPPNFSEGDIFWKMYGVGADMNDNICWDTIEAYPYWIEMKDIIQSTTNKEEMKEKSETDRFDILDL